MPYLNVFGGVYKSPVEGLVLRHITDNDLLNKAIVMSHMIDITKELNWYVDVELISFNADRLRFIDKESEKAYIAKQSLIKYHNTYDKDKDKKKKVKDNGQLSLF